MSDPDDLKKLEEIVKDLVGALSKHQERRGSNQQQILHQHNTGGHAFWMIVVCAAVIFTVAITLGPRVSNTESEVREQNRKIERMQDYLNNIYQQAPWLKPKEENVNDNHHHDSTSPTG